ncbi:MAG: two-component system response regulator TorR [Magnetococcales bacterium]|nr:two-component system response regulator TorR [Magnetococcales bacterium]
MKLNHNILVVEDDPVTRGLMTAYFEKAGFQVYAAANGQEMWELISAAEMDLVLLDINLPGEDGFSLTKNLRYRSEIGIILVTARREDIDRIVGLELGADDYVTKPFNERELLVRVKNLLRRTSKPNQVEEELSIYSFHGWQLNIDQRRLVSPDDEPVHLTNGEFLLLSALVRHPGRVFTRNQLLESVSSREWMPNDRTIDVMINRLRRKIEVNLKEPKILVTVHGVGYQFDV